MDLVLSERRWLRLSSFTAFYVAQGVPIGLVGALLPWLVAEGYSEAEVAWFATWVTAPWAIKLLAGPVMDRFTVPSMGFRRPWALAAQVGLVLALVALAAAGAAGSSLVALTAAGFVINMFAATQDVAVDGMAIDILPLNERGRANAFMAFGQDLRRIGVHCAVRLSRRSSRSRGRRGRLRGGCGGDFWPRRDRPRTPRREAGTVERG